MFILTHTGIDYEAPRKEVLTWPEHVKRAKDMAPDSVFIAAHLGANMGFSRAKEYVGTDGILFDLAWVAEMCRLGVITREEILEIVRTLGEDKVVYGSDYPWANPGTQLKFWEELFSDPVWEKISHKNVERAIF